MTDELFCWWEQAPPEKYPIIAYRCFETTIPVFDAGYRPKKSTSGEPSLFNGSDRAEYESRRITSCKPHIERLPYSERSLRRRHEYGRDVPDWFAETAVEGSSV